MNCFLICFSFFFLFNPILNSDVLSFDLTLYKTKQLIYNDEYCYISMKILGSNKSIKISLGSSQLIVDIGQPKLNVSDIKIQYDNLYPDKTTFGNITEGVFNIDNYENVTLNVLSNVSSYNSILGLSKGVNYNNSTIEKEYDLNFMSQLIKKGIIDKYYIYLTPFFNFEGTKRSDTVLELGRIPTYFDIYNFSYSPLNKKYPNKWSVKLSHIIYNEIKKENIRDIYADVIFTDSYNSKSYIPNKYKTLFKTIFSDHMDCEIKYYMICPLEKIKESKIYFVFNGFAHLIPNSLLFLNGNGTHNFSIFEFSSEIDYISIDSYIFGIYHRLYDGENNTVRFVYPNNKDFIIDVSHLTGFENRNGTKKEVESIEYLRDYERKLKREEMEINVTLKNIEEMKKDINEKNMSLNQKENELIEREKKLNDRTIEIEKQIENFEKEIKNLKMEIENQKDKIGSLNNEIKNKKDAIEKLNEENVKIKNDLNDNKMKDTQTINNEKRKSFIELIAIIILIITLILVIVLFIIKGNKSGNSIDKLSLLSTDEKIN